jgi:hypothetical protein
MDPLSSLTAIGLELPSPAYIVGAIIFGLVGWAAFRRGRSGGRKITLWLGVALMVYPYLVPGTLALYLVGLALCAGLYFDRS